MVTFILLFFLRESDDIMISEILATIIVHLKAVAVKFCVDPRNFKDL